jgi:FAD/FMN-containing dehydrogenase
VTASESENEDLFWGIKGGGCNFGVVTEFEYQLHKLGPTVLAGLALWPVAKAPEVLRGWRDYVEGAPDELTSACVILTGPPEEFIPEHLQGQPCIGMAAMYVGDPGEGASVIQPLKDLEPDVDLIMPMPYVEFQAMLDPGNQPGFRNYWKGEYLTGCSDDAIDTFVEHAKEPISPFNQIVMFRLGGGVTEVDDDAAAFAHRDAEYLFHPIAMWEDPSDDDRQISFVREFSEAMSRFATGGVYLNFTPDRDRVRDAFGEKYERLVELKDRYDPGNLFQHNQNIKPSGRAPATA